MHVPEKNNCNPYQFQYKIECNILHFVFPSLSNSAKSEIYIYILMPAILYIQTHISLAVGTQSSNVSNYFLIQGDMSIVLNDNNIIAFISNEYYLI